MKAFIIPAICFLTLCVAQGYETLSSELRRNGELIQRAVGKAQQVLQQSSAVCYNGGKEIGYATVISSDGFLLAKWSELKEVKKLKIRIDRKSYDTVQMLQGDPAWDVVLLKVDAMDLLPVTFAKTQQVEIGTWVVANGVTSLAKRRTMVGIISAESRRIPLEGGAVLGVELIEEKGALIAGKIAEKSGAYLAGLRSGDQLISVMGKELKKRTDLLDLMKDRQAGEKVEVVFLRKGKSRKAEVILQSRTEIYGVEKTRNDQMSGDFSMRRSGFARVLQHDVWGSSRTVGGPLLDLDGQCLGMNIARANRAESFAIPQQELQELAQKLLEQSRRELR